MGRIHVGLINWGSIGPNLSQPMFSWYQVNCDFLGPYWHCKPCLTKYIVDLEENTYNTGQEICGTQSKSIAQLLHMKCSTQWLV